MCSNLEARSFKFENYEMTNKLNNILFKLLCMDNFYEVLDYVILKFGELFKLEGIFTVEFLNEKNSVVYRAYNQRECIGISRLEYKESKISELLKNKDCIIIECGAEEKLFIAFEPMLSEADKKIFLPYQEVFKRILASSYKRKLKEEYLTRKSFYDVLTGCHNRNFFELKMKEYRSAVGIGMIVCDMDRLKQINDRLGHSFGDDIIKIFSKKIRKIISKDDFIFRTGGDEFVVITENKSIEYLEKIVDTVKTSFKIYNEKNCVLPISVSIGGYMKSRPNEGIKDILKMADYLMYQHKLEHRDDSEIAINKYIEAIKKNNPKDFRIK
ncbi:GGDEF domain-containing protein [uncultured Clostridium sp.]|jgi:diguanylate cyclase (GGDEF)-like protein|uniref:GGDEF domain-containing protein n=1 Tax=uncultured Clostridium sp. TaxID=59620 RepID=UPI00260E90CD|nr:GGDEF domain-containing protein [uncultured Clostridium sp.]